MAAALIPAAYHAKLAQLLTDFGSKRFRRSDLEKLLYPLTSPLSHDQANMLAEVILREAAAKGTVRREGRMHWLRVDSSRKTVAGRLMPELAEPIALKLNTKVPSKWASVDLETGQVWMGTAKGWVEPSSEFLAELKAVVKNA